MNHKSSYKPFLYYWEEGGGFAVVATCCYRWSNSVETHHLVSCLH